MLIAVYKCRYCSKLIKGGTFPHANTVSLPALNSALEIMEKIKGGPSSGSVYSETIFHDCKSHIAVSDFVGFRK
jgi:hypothetical protein